MVKTKRIWSVALFAIIATVAIGITTPSRPVYAASADVIINEIMYNPASGNNADEYIELHNTTDSDINIGNWFITAGAGNNIGSGTILPARGYVLISPSPTQTLATYGKSTVATYAGQLSNGGGTITLRDAVNNVVNSVTYDDASPWPLNPDGHGPSLELKDPELDNSLASSWGTSITITPGEQNSWVGISSSDFTIIVTTSPSFTFVGLEISLQSIDDDKGKLTVLVSIFDRETPIEIDFLQVHKI
jgi:hypothetical protein